MRLFGTITDSDAVSLTENMTNRLWYSGSMKRYHIAPAVGLIVAAQFQKERENSECMEPPCAVQQNVAMPEPQHASEELPNYDVVGSVRWLLNTSPIIGLKVGSEEDNQWLREQGMRIG